MWGWFCVGRSVTWFLTKEEYLEQETHKKLPFSTLSCLGVLGSSGNVDGSAEFAHVLSGSQPSLPCPMGTAWSRSRASMGWRLAPFSDWGSFQGSLLPASIQTSARRQLHLLPGSWACLFSARLCSGWLSKCRVGATCYVRDKGEHI